MNETHYTQMKKEHANGRTLKLSINGRHESVYCKPKDSIEAFITKCKLAESLELDFSISSGIEKTHEEKLENVLNSISNDSVSQELKDLIDDKTVKDIKNVIDTIEKIMEDQENEDQENECNHCSNDSSNDLGETTKTKIAIIDDISSCLKSNNNRISHSLISRVLDMKATVIKYHHLTPHMRACTITLPTGHEVIGITQVLDIKNDVEEIGNKVALENATREVWKVIGNIAKTVMDPSDG